MTDVKRVRIEYELDDGTVRYVQCSELVDFDLNLSQEPRETTWDNWHALPTHRTWEPGPLVALQLRVTAKAAERSAP